MANEKFKVKFGLAVGDTVATVDGTTGNIITTGTIDVQGGTVTDSTGALSITTGAANGAITLDPNGTGNVVMTFADGGNLTNDRNYVSGIIRIPAAQTAGDIWGFNTGTTNPYRGISIDNTASSTTTTGKRTGLVMRNYSNAPRNSIIGESARGTNPSNPLILTNNSNLVEMNGNGYAATSNGTGFQATGCTITGTTLTIGTVTSGAPAVGQLISSITYPNVVTAGTTITANISGSGSGSTWTVSASQTVASSTIWGGGDGWIASNNGVPAGLRFQAFENWTTQTSGTGMIVTLSPLAATNGIAGAGFNALSMSLNSTTLASDSQTFRTKPVAAGGTNKVMLQLAETTSTLNADTFNINSSTTGQNFVSVNSGSGDVVLSVNQQRATTNNDNALINFSTFRWDGTQYTPTQSGDTIGEFKFNGNVFTGLSPGTTTGPGASINATATENWTTTATGTNFRFNAVRTGTLNSYDIISGNSNSLAFNCDTVNFNSYDYATTRVSVDGNAATINLPVNLYEIGGVTPLVGNKISYNRVYGQWQHDATITPAAANTAYAIPFQGVNSTIDFANIATTSNTSEIRPNALGMYKLQFSAQVQNSDNGQDHQITFWWRKNGTNISNSAGYFTVPKAGVANGSLIVGWDNMVEVTTITDYFELIYAVNNTAVTLPYIAAAAPAPGAASVFLTLVPIGA